MALGRPKVALIVTDDEPVQLNSLAHRSRTAPHLARRARIILACAEGSTTKTRLRFKAPVSPGCEIQHELVAGNLVPPAFRTGARAGRRRHTPVRHSVVDILPQTLHHGGTPEVESAELNHVRAKACREIRANIAFETHHNTPFGAVYYILSGDVAVIVSSQEASLRAS
jgi:hypothetical protein